MPSTLDVAVNILKDPALPQFIQRVQVLKKILLADEPVPPGGKPTGPKPPEPPGIGLDSAVKAIDSYLWFRQNQWVVAVAAGGVILVPALLGFFLGRLSARSSKPALAGSRGRARKKRPLATGWTEWRRLPGESNDSAAHRMVAEMGFARAKKARKGFYDMHMTDGSVTRYTTAGRAYSIRGPWERN